MIYPIELNWSSVTFDGAPINGVKTIDLTWERKPDAVLFPAVSKMGTWTRQDKFLCLDLDIEGMLSQAEKIMAATPAKKVHVRRVIERTGRKSILATLASDDTMFYPFGHAKEGEPRYRWELLPSGIEYGYLA